MEKRETIEDIMDDILRLTEQLEVDVKSLGTISEQILKTAKTEVELATKLKGFVN